MTRMSYRYKVCLKCQHYPCKKEKECIEVNLKTMQIYFNNFDRKTEPQTEHTPTEVETMSCEECRHYRVGKPCEPFLNESDCRYEPKTDCSWK